MVDKEAEFKAYKEEHVETTNLLNNQLKELRDQVAAKEKTLTQTSKELKEREDDIIELQKKLSVREDLKELTQTASNNGAGTWSVSKDIYDEDMDDGSEATKEIQGASPDNLNQFTNHVQKKQDINLEVAQLRKQIKSKEADRQSSEKKLAQVTKELHELQASTTENVLQHKI